MKDSFLKECWNIGLFVGGLALLGYFVGRF